MYTIDKQYHRYVLPRHQLTTRRQLTPMNNILSKHCVTQVIVLVLGVSLCVTASTKAQNSTIITLPATITSPGNYVVGSDYTTAQNGIIVIAVYASNVTIDMQNHVINGPTNVSNVTTVGIAASEQRNITIRNGTINNCLYGIQLTGNRSSTTNNTSHRIENMRFNSCSTISVYLDTAPSSFVTDCQFSNMGGSTINATAGVNCAGSIGATVKGCIFTGFTVASGGTSFGIYSGSGSYERENQISGAGYGIIYGIYQDNLAYNCITPFSAGTDAGGNTHN